jgi:hypothetical protein
MKIEEIRGILEGFESEQIALHGRKRALQAELKNMEIRFHRGAGAILALRNILAMYGEYVASQSTEQIVKQYDIPMAEDEAESLRIRTLGPGETTEKQLAQLRESVYERQAMDWVGVLDRRDHEDAGSGSGVGVGGSPTGENRPTGEEPLGGEPDQRQSENGRSDGRGP